MDFVRSGCCARVCGDSGALFFSALLGELLLAIILWTSAFYCTTTNDGSSISGGAEDHGLFCWLAPPAFVDGLDASVIRADVLVSLVILTATVYLRVEQACPC